MDKLFKGLLIGGLFALFVKNINEVEDNISQHPLNNVKPKYRSKGEEEVGEALIKLGKRFDHQYRIPQMSNRPYDFMIENRGSKIVIEHDGKQHFRYVPKFHTPLVEQHRIDSLKTTVARTLGYHVIRVDYTCKGKILEHVKEALRRNESLYLSNQKLYKHINTPPPKCLLKKECPVVYKMKFGDK